MIKVSIPSPVVRSNSGIGKTSGKPYSMHFQDAWLHTVDENGTPHFAPQKVETILDKNEDGTPKPFAVGEYTLHPSSVYVDRAGKAALSLRLVPVKKSVA